ncbi:kinase-like protein [Apiospora sp. TS-2023a]
MPGPFVSNDNLSNQIQSPALSLPNHSHRKQPTVYVVHGSGERRSLCPADYSPSAISASESESSDFSTIETINDLGLSDAQQYSNHNHAMVPGSSFLSVSNSHGRQQVPRVLIPFNEELVAGVGNHPDLRHAVTVRPNSIDFERALDDDIRSEDIVNDASNELLRALQGSHFHGNDTQFLPRDVVFDKVDNKRVAKLLYQTFDDNQDSIRQRLDDICSNDHNTSRRMIFATLIIMGRIERIDDFILNDICDIDLPLRHVKDVNKGQSFSLRQDNSSVRSCFDHWERREFLQFFDYYQFYVVAPYFDIGGRRVCFYKMESNIRLPFLKWVPQRAGGEGMVSKVQIHRAHHSYPRSQDDLNPHFAIKYILADAYKRFKEEVSVLEHFSGDKTGHDHLVRLLMAFQHGTKYYLLFPWASGNLAELWETDKSPKRTAIVVRWIMKQCNGLAAGLAKLHTHRSWKGPDGHRNLGRHGDIKPANILWFARYNQVEIDHLVISDFGLARFHSANSVNTNQRSMRGFSSTYRPPEADIEGELCRLYDIWSMACLYLEFVTWYLVGYDRTRGHDTSSFTACRTEDDDTRYGYKEDKFFRLSLTADQSTAAAIVKHSVKKWINDLRGLEHCPQSLLDFLDLIETHMLLPVVKDRKPAAFVQKQIEDIYNRCLGTNSDDYCLKRDPDRTNKPPEASTMAEGQLRSST